MSTKSMDTELLSRMFIAGAMKLKAKKDLINELNVFPVPDGDTGTNMTMTIMSAVDAIRELKNPTMKELAKAISGGSLRGARGNSGVILSQLCRGFTKVIRNTDTVDMQTVAEAAEKAVETAYKAVMKPKEGTILTVAKGVSTKVRKIVEEDPEVEFASLLGQAVDYGNEVLERTPDMLPVLKKAGVVDSGGKGLITILEGAYDCLTGKTVEYGEETAEPEEEEEEKVKFGYYAEFTLHAEKPLSDAERSRLQAYLTGAGDAETVITPDALIKVQIYTDQPGEVITKALALGQLTGIRLENIRADEEPEKSHPDAGVQKDAAPEETQTPEEETPQEPDKETGFIAVCAGDGFTEIFKGLNVDYVISGGQTMNPSTDDFLKAIDKVHAKNIFVLPDNKNIILAANQARDLTKDRNIIVIPTKTVPQGITAVINYAPDKSPSENEEIMNEMIRSVHTSQVTYAIRDTSVDDQEIHKGDIMAVGDNGILCVGKDISKVAADSVEAMMTEESELISIYYGEGFSEEDAAALGDTLSEKYADCDVEVNRGGQPVYYCVLSVE